MQDADSLTPGFMIVHGNRLDDLRALAVSWMQRYPLAPLENEVVLVQSNGIAQWLKLALAEDPEQGGCGIAAALEVQLPARFLWQTYRAVMGAESTPEHSPLDKAPLGWRLMRLLPQVLGEPGFQSLQRFLEDDADLRKRHQLAERLADLFDQYQVYRADWLEDWAAGRDQLQQVNAPARPLPEESRWQAQLWRALLTDVGAGALAHSRAGVHQHFVERLQTLAQRPSGLPRRILVFGISSMPAQVLEALAMLARFCQVLLCVHNPCRHHWIDIVADKELLLHQYRRQPHKAGSQALGDATLHLHGQPLLAAWGKQGRDYINLLDSYDDPASYRELFASVNGGRIDLFSEEAGSSLLTQLQGDILELRPLAETRERWPAVDPASDRSLRFHIAHSAQREVEILHDQLLARFSADQTLTPRDVIVMVPDVNAYAPHIEAVFGQLARHDPRYIPFTLADQGQRGREPLLIALEHLLKLPHSRFSVSDILDLLDVPALRARFGIAESDLPTLQRWIAGAGIRWGLDGAQRQSLDMPAGLEQNTWRFGLRRMLLGYAAGKAPALHGIEPYDEVSGLEAALAGPLLTLLEHLDIARLDLQQAAPPRLWAERLQALLKVFFQAQGEADELLLNQLLQVLEDWLQTCEQANFSEPLPLNVVHEVWLGGMDQGGLAQRFLAGSVNFCTLMPMRAIPFRLVCLLGMNDGDYPRQQAQVDFDLMRHDYRPGDRSRREDDRYLLLEALLSAREQLYVSWVGRNIRDNSERVPSVLIGQLRDHLAAGWRLQGNPGEPRALLAALTTEHPLQPFSTAYFGAQAGADGLFTYSHEWREVHTPTAVQVAQALPPLQQDSPLNLRQLAGFLRDPVTAFFEQRLKVHFDEDELASCDDEPFELDALENWQYQDALSQTLKRWVEERYDAAQTGSALQEQVQRLQREGKLPLAGFGPLAAASLTAGLPDMLARYHAMLQEWSQPLAGQIELKCAASATAPGFSDWLGGLRRNARGQLAYLQLDSKKLCGKDGYRWHNLIRPWLRHLALQLGGEPCSSILVSLSGDVHFLPVEAASATEQLQDILQCWAAGMCQPLPLACKTAFAWLAAADSDADKAMDEARKAFEGAYQRRGEVQDSPALRRAYADFDALCADGQFARLAEQLYGALFRHLCAARAGSAE
ncbi:exodeoxyribonuclease V subunit gamma [Pseudomonas sp. N040]|uniref:exodeoxyribonuclease V subunit gamma n=1 Tax=Pseudomonas sp. N040 TaxID=2785325 RepID=UPI0018A29235|nr:exodeoxyribonuclease V subunit gamma [Pseudomonas sp. N040]MBF7730735.1 exodeoxyribonuclease V subunit gamma [Pseudomonas sp. N040]MBW7014378.1 exodeoxyribonuclease V subunit gamma [Pseudomonas sp. N040]